MLRSNKIVRRVVSKHAKKVRLNSVRKYEYLKDLIVPTREEINYESVVCNNEDIDDCVNSVNTKFLEKYNDSFGVINDLNNIDLSFKLVGNSKDYEFIKDHELVFKTAKCNIAYTNRANYGDLKCALIPALAGIEINLVDKSISAINGVLSALFPNVSVPTAAGSQFRADVSVCVREKINVVRVLWRFCQIYMLCIFNEMGLVKRFSVSGDPETENIADASAFVNMIRSQQDSNVLVAVCSMWPSFSPSLVSSVFLDVMAANVTAKGAPSVLTSMPDIGSNLKLITVNTSNVTSRIRKYVSSEVWSIATKFSQSLGVLDQLMECFNSVSALCLSRTGLSSIWNSKNINISLPSAKLSATRLYPILESYNNWLDNEVAVSEPDFKSVIINGCYNQMFLEVGIRAFMSMKDFGTISFMKSMGLDYKFMMDSNYCTSVKSICPITISAKKLMSKLGCDVCLNRQIASVNMGKDTDKLISWFCRDQVLNWIDLIPHMSRQIGNDGILGYLTGIKIIDEVLLGKWYKIKENCEASLEDIVSMIEQFEIPDIILGCYIVDREEESSKIVTIGQAKNCFTNNFCHINKFESKSIKIELVIKFETLEAKMKYDEVINNASSLKWRVLCKTEASPEDFDELPTTSKKVFLDDFRKMNSKGKTKRFFSSADSEDDTSEGGKSSSGESSKEREKSESDSNSLSSSESDDDESKESERSASLGYSDEEELIKELGESIEKEDESYSSIDDFIQTVAGISIPDMSVLTLDDKVNLLVEWFGRTSEEEIDEATEKRLRLILATTLNTPENQDVRKTLLPYRVLNTSKYIRELGLVSKIIKVKNTSSDSRDNASVRATLCKELFNRIKELDVHKMLETTKPEYRSRVCKTLYERLKTTFSPGFTNFDYSDANRVLRTIADLSESLSQHPEITLEEVQKKIGIDKEVIRKYIKIGDESQLTSIGVGVFDLLIQQVRSDYRVEQTNKGKKDFKNINSVEEVKRFLNNVSKADIEKAKKVVDNVIDVKKKQDIEIVAISCTQYMQNLDGIIDLYAQGILDKENFIATLNEYEIRNAAGKELISDDAEETKKLLLARNLEMCLLKHPDIEYNKDINEFRIKKKDEDGKKVKKFITKNQLRKMNNPAITAALKEAKQKIEKSSIEQEEEENEIGKRNKSSYRSSKTKKLEKTENLEITRVPAEIIRNVLAHHVDVEKLTDDEVERIKALAAEDNFREIDVMIEGRSEYIMSPKTILLPHPIEIGSTKVPDVYAANGEIRAVTDEHYDIVKWQNSEGKDISHFKILAEGDGLNQIYYCDYELSDDPDEQSEFKKFRLQFLDYKPELSRQISIDDIDTELAKRINNAVSACVHKFGFTVTKVKLSDLFRAEGVEFFKQNGAEEVILKEIRDEYFQNFRVASCAKYMKSRPVSEKSAKKVGSVGTTVVSGMSRS